MMNTKRLPALAVSISLMLLLCIAFIVAADEADKESMTREGQMIAGHGQALIGKGELKMDEGRLEMKEGKFLTGRGKAMQTGRMPDKEMRKREGELLTEKGQLLMKRGQMLTERGKAMQEGEVRVVHGEAIPEAVVVDRDTMTREGKLLAESGRIMTKRGEMMIGKAKSMKDGATTTVEDKGHQEVVWVILCLFEQWGCCMHKRLLYPRFGSL
jgi:hypothetical protein